MACATALGTWQGTSVSLWKFCRPWRRCTLSSRASIIPPGIVYSQSVVECFRSVAVNAFVIVVELNSKRRESDEKIDVLFSTMRDMMEPLQRQASSQQSWAVDLKFRPPSGLQVTPQAGDLARFASHDASRRTRRLVHSQGHSNDPLATRRPCPPDSAGHQTLRECVRRLRQETAPHQTHPERGLGQHLCAVHRALCPPARRVSLSHRGAQW